METLDIIRMTEDNRTVRRETEEEVGDGGGLTLENHLWIYTAPVILLLSVTGNSLTLVVMSRKRMCVGSSSVYLRALALADMFVVVVGIIPEWLDQAHIVRIWDLDPWICRVELWLFYGALDFAIWILVAFSGDRFIAVCMPLRKRDYCTRTRARLCCAAVLALANLNAHVFWTRGAVRDQEGVLTTNCGDLDAYAHFERQVRPWLVLALAVLLPFLAILVSNAAIVSGLLRSRTLRSRTLREPNDGCNVEEFRIRSTTCMCLSVSFTFLVLVTPNIVLLIGKHRWHDSATYRNARAVTSQLVYVNHSINFVLYALTGSRFREELRFRSRDTSDTSSPSPKCTSSVPGSCTASTSIRGQYT